MVKPKDEEMYQRLGESQRERRQKPDFKFYQLPKLFCFFCCDYIIPVLCEPNMNFQGISESFLKKINVNHQFTIISYNVIIGEFFFYEGGYFMFQILVVEDDASLRKLMSAALKQHGYVTFLANDGLEALDVLEKTNIDLIISDIMMPNMDGYELTRQLRKADFNLPILMVTAKETFEDKQEGFSAGTDDYMVKPIDINEMILRVGALLRRSKMASEHSLTVGNCVLDYDAMSVAVDGGAAETIPQMEFKLLFKLLSYPDKIFTRRQLLDELWGMDKDVDERTVDVHVKRLRERYGSCESFDIVTVRGLGYKAVKKQ